MTIGQPHGFDSRSLFDRIKNDAVQRTAFLNAKPANLYIQEEILPQGTIIQPKRQEIFIEQNTVMVFVDEAPQYNWAHPCHYLLYELNQGQIKEVSAKLPPYLTETPNTYHLFHEQVPTPEEKTTWSVPQETTTSTLATDGNRYAVLFSGSSNNRHVNDLEFLYRTLVDVYAYTEDNIYVLNYDGTINFSGGPKPVSDWPGDSTPYRMIVKGTGTRSELDDVLDELKTRLDESDSLLIHTNNHGDHDGTESSLLSYSGPDYPASDFATKLAQLPKINRLIVMMEQCYSGGFRSPILLNSPAALTSLAFACEELKSSMGGADFDPFARDWIAAMNGADPYGASLSFNPDVDGNGGVTAHEAFNYADAIKDPNDTPVYDQSSVAAGNCRLS